MDLKPRIKVCIAAGGTGGHLLPGIALGRALRDRGHRVHFLVRQDGTTQAHLAREGFASSAFRYTGLPRGLSPRLLLFPLLSLAAYLAARRILKRERPDVVVGMGGYVSAPVGVAAARMKVPLVIHEQNSRAGLANRLLARRAVAVGLTFDATEGLAPGAALTRVTGLPLRPDLVYRDPGQSRLALGLDPERMTFLVFGGSQGARALNRYVTAALAHFPDRRQDWQFIHLTGNADVTDVGDAYAALGWRAFVRAYWSDMAAVYSAADVAVARAGAGTVMELAHLGVQALLIPYPHAAANHQEANARWLERSGQARVALEKDLTQESFNALLRGLPPLADIRRENLRRRTSAPPPAAADNLADLVEEVCF